MTATQPAGSEARDPEAVSRFIERFAQVFTEAGMPRIASRVFVALVATDSGRLTAPELAESLRASPAAISGAVRYLTQVNLVRRGREPGSRRDHYQVDQDVWYQTITQRDQLLALWVRHLQEGATALGEQSPAGRRLAESVRFFEFLRTELEAILDRWASQRDKA